MASTAWPDVSVRRLRVKLPPEDFDPLSVRLHLARQLSQFEPTIPWLSPSAVLCIRHLPDPRPGALRLRGGDLGPPRDWERAFLGVVEDKVRRAVRPALGFVPSDAEAVVFADRGELLACLALDLDSGLAGARWWWATLFREVELPRAFASSLAREPEYVPPVFERLATAGRVGAILRFLPERESAAILRSLRERFGLPGEWVPAPSATSAEAPPRAPARAIAGERAWSAPFREWIPALEIEGSAPQARALVVTALLLRRAPFVVRSPWFAAELAALRDERRSEPASSKQTSSKQASSSHAVSSTAPYSEPDGDAAGTPQPELPSIARPRTARQQPIERDVVWSEDGAHREHAHGAQPPPSLRGSSPLPPGRLGDATSDSATNAAQPERAEVELAVATETPPPSSEVHAALAGPDSPRPSALSELQRIYGAASATKLGGAFYLVNVALALELYPDFTRPSSRGLDIAIWDFVGLIAQRLLGEAEAEPDPIWDLLAALAGREGGPLSLKDLEPPERRLPPGWASPESTASVNTDADGFESWLEWLLPHVRYRLSRALGLLPEDDLGQVLLRHTARVHVSDSHVDVLLSLAELPVAVRAAGLDRDPGFLPTAGRFLAFHFR
jgi:hypothetical protein